MDVNQPIAAKTMAAGNFAKGNHARMMPATTAQNEVFRYLRWKESRCHGSHAKTQTSKARSMKASTLRAHPRTPPLANSSANEAMSPIESAL
jgi:hypothetical protein